MQTRLIIEDDAVDSQKVKSSRHGMDEEKEKMTYFRIIIVINILRSREEDFLFGGDSHPSSEFPKQANTKTSDR